MSSAVCLSCSLLDTCCACIMFDLCLPPERWYYICNTAHDASCAEVATSYSAARHAALACSRLVAWGLLDLALGTQQGLSRDNSQIIEKKTKNRPSLIVHRAPSGSSGNTRAACWDPSPEGRRWRLLLLLLLLLLCPPPPLLPPHPAALTQRCPYPAQAPCRTSAGTAGTSANGWPRSRLCSTHIAAGCNFCAEGCAAHWRGRSECSAVQSKGACWKAGQRPTLARTRLQCPLG